MGPEHLLTVIAELGAGPNIQIDGTAEAGIRLVNLAILNSEPLAKLVLALSAVEALGQTENWSSGQRSVLSGLAGNLEAGPRATDPETLEVADALRRSMHRLGLRQGVMRVLNAIGLGHLKADWDRIYSARSGIFHGTARVDGHDIGTLSNDAVALAVLIVLTVVERQGLALPAATKSRLKSLSSES